jgi:hypothetical protein
MTSGLRGPAISQGDGVPVRVLRVFLAASLRDPGVRAGPPARREVEDRVVECLVPQASFLGGDRERL